MKSKYSGAAYLTRLALLLAIVIIMTVFNFGNIPIGPIVATLYQVPVIIGAVILGTSGGCILGAAWGIVCFILAITGQTTDIVALAVVQQNPLMYFAIAFVPRLLTGLFAGLIFAGMDKIVPHKYNPVSFAVTGVFGSLTNTVFYLGALYIFIKDMLASLYSIEIGAVGAMVMGVALSNGLLEALLSAVVVMAVCKAVTVVEKAK
ncbi:MAG: ECF transporter S component [Oscillospiraceae bacterium]